MASLTDTLSSSNPNKPIIATEVEMPDYFGMATNVVKGYLAAQPTEADRRAQATAESAAREQAAMSELAGGVLDALDGVEPPQEIKDHATKIGRMKKAGVSPVQIDAEVQSVIKRVRSKYPEYTDKYYAWLNDNGLDDFVFREAKEKGKARETEAQAKNAAFTAFSTTLTEQGYDITTMSRSEIITRGSAINKKKAEFAEMVAINNEARAASQEERAAADQTREEDKYVKASREEATVDAVLGGVGVTRGPRIAEIHKLAVEAQNDPAKEKLYRETVQRFLVGSSADRMQARREVGAVDPTELARIDEYFDEEEKLLKSLLSEDMSSNFRMAENIKAWQQGNTTEAYQFMPEFMFWADITGQAGVAAIVDSFKREKAFTNPLQEEVTSHIRRRAGGKPTPTLDKAIEAIKTPTPQKLGELKTSDPKAYNYAVQLSSMSLPGVTNEMITNPTPETNKYFANALLPVALEAANMPSTVASSKRIKAVITSLPPGQTVLAINNFVANGGDPMVADQLRGKTAEAYFNALQAGLKDYNSNALGSTFSPTKAPGVGLGVVTEDTIAPRVSYNEALGLFEGGMSGGRRSEVTNNLNLLLGATIALEKERGVIPKGMSELTARKFLVDGVGGYQKMVDELNGVTVQVDSWNSSVTPVQVMLNQKEIAEQEAKEKGGVSMVKKTDTPKKAEGNAFTRLRAAVDAERNLMSKEDPFYAQLQAIDDFTASRLNGDSKFAQNGTIGTGAKINIKGLDSTKISPRIEEYVPIIEQKAAQYNVPQELIIAMMDQESRGQKDVVSPAGAQGLMQLMPGTAKDLGVDDPFDPEQNIDGGVRYMSQKLAAFDGDVELALMSYNWGEARVKRWVENGRTGKVPEETKDYVEKILGRLNYD